MDSNVAHGASRKAVDHRSGGVVDGRDEPDDRSAAPGHDGRARARLEQRLLSLGRSRGWAGKTTVSRSFTNNVASGALPDAIRLGSSASGGESRLSRHETPRPSRRQWREVRRRAARPGHPGIGSTCSPMPRTRAHPPVRKNGTSAPSRSASSRSRCSGTSRRKTRVQAHRERLRRCCCRRQGQRRAGSALSIAMVTRRRGLARVEQRSRRRVRRDWCRRWARRGRRNGRRRRVSRARLRSLTAICDAIDEIDRGEDRIEQMIAVGASADDAQAEIHLGRRAARRSERREGSRMSRPSRRMVSP